MTEPFDDVDLLRDRLSGLVDRFHLGDQAQEIVAETLEELAVVVEELQIQNAALVAGRTELERERQRYQQLFDAVPDAYLVTTIEGVILEANSTACDLLGSPSSALITRSLARHVAPMDHRAFFSFLSRMSQLEEGGMLSIDLTVRDHRLIPATLRATVGNSPSNTKTLRWLVQDRRAELAINELRISEQRLRAFFDAAEIGIVLCDREGDIVFINPRALITLGFESDATAPPDWLRHVPSAERLVVDAKIAEAINGMGSESVRHRIVVQTDAATSGSLEARDSSHDIDELGVPAPEQTVPEQTVRWVEHGFVPYSAADGQPNGFVSTLIDVTSEHNAVIDLARSRDFAAAIVETTAAIVVVAELDGRVRLFNPRAEQVSGWSADEAIEQSVVDLLVAAEHRDNASSMLDAAASGRSVAWEDEWAAKAGGRSRIAWVASPLKGPDDTIEAIIVTGIDVTDKRRLEQRIAQSERLHSIGRLASGVAHDFNNTLAVLLARAERIDRRTNNPDTSADIEGFRRTIENSKTMIGDLLTFSGRMPLVDDLTDVNLELIGTTDMLIDLLGREIDIQLELIDAETTVAIDPGRFEQIITNLAINARDAMPDGGTLTVATSIETVADGRDSHGRITATLPVGAYVAVTVTDTGTGIPAETIERVFEPYFTTKERGQGTGIGLAMVYGIVQQAQGEVIVESEPGEWTRFTIWLRLVDSNNDTRKPGYPTGHDPTSPAHPVPTDKAGSPGSSNPPTAALTTILVVEDDHEVRQLLVDQLRDAGYRTIETDRGDTALGMIDEAIDLLISDIDLPGADGFAVSSRFLGVYPTLPVLLVSGVGSFDLLQQLPDNVTFLAKPFTQLELLATLDELLAAKT